MWLGVVKSLNGASSRILNGPGTKSRLFRGVTGTYSSENIMYCTGPAVAPASAQVEVPNSQRIRCLNSSLGRAFACGAGGAEVRDMFVLALS